MMGGDDMSPPDFWKRSKVREDVLPHQTICKEEVQRIREGSNRDVGGEMRWR